MYQRILVPLDGSFASELGLKEAIEMALPMKATLVLLHVIDDFSVMLEMSSVWNFDEGRRALRQEGERLLDQAAERVMRVGLTCEKKLTDVKNHPIADVIIEQARDEKCDLIVMGTHGRRGLTRLTLGSNAELVLRQTPVPVLLAREKPHATP